MKKDKMLHSHNWRCCPNILLSSTTIRWEFLEFKRFVSTLQADKSVELEVYFQQIAVKRLP